MCKTVLVEWEDEDDDDDEEFLCSKLHKSKIKAVCGTRTGMIIGTRDANGDAGALTILMAGEVSSHLEIDTLPTKRKSKFKQF